MIISTFKSIKLLKTVKTKKSAANNKINVHQMEDHLLRFAVNSSDLQQNVQWLLPHADTFLPTYISVVIYSSILKK